MLRRDQTHFYNNYTILCTNFIGLERDISHFTDTQFKGTYWLRIRVNRVPNVSNTSPAGKTHVKVWKLRVNKEDWNLRPVGHRQWSCPGPLKYRLFGINVKNILQLWEHIPRQPIHRKTRKSRTFRRQLVTTLCGTAVAKSWWLLEIVISKSQPLRNPIK